MRPQQEALRTDLNALRLVRALLDVRSFALLHVHRLDAVFIDLNQVDLRDQSQPRIRQLDRAHLLHEGAGAGRRLVSALALGTDPIPRPIHGGMAHDAFHRVGAVGELPVHPLEDGQPRAVDELVQHPGGDEGSVVIGRGHSGRIGQTPAGGKRPRRAGYRRRPFLGSFPRNPQE